MEKILGWRDFKIKSRTQRRLGVVNFEFDTEPNPCTYIWMQRPPIQQSHWPHPTQHREFDESSILVSPLWCEKLEGLIARTHTMEKVLGWRDFKIKSRMQRVFDVVNFEFDTEPNPRMYLMQKPRKQQAHGPHPNGEFDGS